MGSSSIPLVLPRIHDPRLELRKYSNWLLALLDRRRRAAEATARPFELTIDPATLCQLSCPYCSTGAGTMQRTRGVLGADMHRRFLEELGETAFLIWYFSTGEPLLNKRLAEIVSLTRDREIYSVISTNLSLPISDERLDALLGCGLGCISVSCDGACPETYSRYRVGGDFDLVQSNMRRLVERKRELGLEWPNIEWRFLVFRHNQHEVARVRELADRVGVDLLEFFPGYAPPDAPEDAVRSADQLDIEPSLSGPALERASRRPPTTLMRHLGEGVGAAPPPSGVRGYGEKCDWLYFGTALFPNGSVSPCCLSNEEVDDFGRVDAASSFAEVWNGEAYREARALFENGRWAETARVCARCPNRDAQDLQFRTTTQALLRNAPDWVLRILSHDPDRFFFESDFSLCPLELTPIRQSLLPLPWRFPEIERDLDRLGGAYAPWLREALAAARRVDDGRNGADAAPA